MITSARPALFGRGEQTLMDLSVPDTRETTPDQVTLAGLGTGTTRYAYRRPLCSLVQWRGAMRLSSDIL
jgi:hypothetical protein